MSPRTGRPTTNPKSEVIKVRATKDDKKILDDCCKLLNATQYQVVMDGIKMVYKNAKK